MSHNLEQGLRTYWLGLAPVTALIGSRLYALVLPQSPTYPAVRFQVISQVGSARSHQGEGLLRGVRIQVDSLATVATGGDPFESVKAVAASLQALSGFRGSIGSAPVIVRIAAAWLFNVSDSYDAAELKLVKRMQEYTVWYYED